MASRQQDTERGSSTREGLTRRVAIAAASVLLASIAPTASAATFDAELVILRALGPECLDPPGSAKRVLLHEFGSGPSKLQIVDLAGDAYRLQRESLAEGTPGAGIVVDVRAEDAADADAVRVRWARPDCSMDAKLQRGARRAPIELEAAQQSVVATALLAESRELIAAGRVAQARATAEQAVSVREALFGPTHRATRDALRTAAMAQAWQGELLPALDRFALACPSENEPTAALDIRDVSCQIDRLEPMLWASRLREADSISSQLASIEGDRLSRAQRLRVQVLRAETLRQTSRISDARSAAEAAATAAAEWLAPEHQLRAIVQGQLARVYLSRGASDMLAAAETSVKLHEAAFGASHPRTGQALALQGVANLEQGRLIESLQLLERAFGVVSDALGPDHVLSIGVLFNLGGPYLLLGRDEEGLEIYRKVEAGVSRAFGPHHSLRLIALRNIGVALRRLGRPAEALAADLELVEAARNGVGPRHEATLAALRSLSTDYYALGRMDEALAVNREAIDLHLAVYGPDHSYTLHQRSQFARIMRGMKRYDEAVAEGERVLRDVERIQGEYHHEAFGVMGNLADSYEAAGRLQDARALNERFVARFERLRDNAALAVEWRQSYFATVSNVYENLAKYYVAEGREEDAFRIAELTKARTLLESLLAKRAEESGVLPPADVEALAARERAIADLTGRIGASRNVEERARLEAERNGLALALSEARAELRTRFPRYAQLSDVTVPSKAQATKLLGHDTVLIDYALADRKLLAFVITSNELRAIDLGSRENLESVIEAYRHLLEGRSPDRVWQIDDRFVIAQQRPDPRAVPVDLATVGARLSQQLLEPMAKSLRRYTSWLISPAGVLAVLPFEALPFDGNPVIAGRRLSYVQSVSVLKLMRERAPRQADASFFAMGAPAYGAPPTERNPLAGKAGPAAIRAVMRGSRGASINQAFEYLGQTWDPLPEAATEVQGIGRLFPARTTSVLLGDDASEARLNQMNAEGTLARYRYVHFATHAYLSTEVPALSSLVLAQRGNPPTVDGYVTASEWLKLKLDSDLIVLSACQTALGRQVDGEGVMGLPFAMFVAGNRMTLMTLWPVKDDVASRFMLRFYKRLRSGQTPATALAAVKNEFRLSGRDANPLHWAGFVLYGVEAKR